jgi:integrase
MAYFRKCKAGVRVQIDKMGVRKSATKLNMTAARAWATQEEAEILAGRVSKWPRKTVADALTRYDKEVSPTKPSGEFEKHRLLAFQKNYPALSAKIISDVTPADLAGWRDDRLTKVTPGSVQRDVNLLRNVWTVAAREWQWCPEPSPWKGLRLPGDNPPRDRLIRWQEARRILRRCDYRTGQRPETGMQEVGWAFLIALRTALRAGELMGLTGESLDVARGVVRLDDHKTVAQVGRRLVPLTRHGRRLLAVLARPGRLFALSPASLDTLFRRARDQVMLDGITFHDSRAAALTYLSRKVDVLTLARISGHKDIATLNKHYYRESAEQVAARIA